MTAPDADGLFASQYLYWVGVDTDPGASPQQLAEFDDFYANVHFPEVLDRNPGFDHAARFRLQAPDPRGDFGPTWLAVYGIRDRAAADAYVARGRTPGAPYTRGPALFDSISLRWRLMWHQVFAIGERLPAPENFTVVGMDASAVATSEDIADFTEFYNSVHVPEVLASGHYTAGTRFESFQVLAHPDPPGSPQYCAVYEGRPDTAAGPPVITPGPPAWEKRTTAWRLRYQRVGELVTAAAG